MGHYTEIRSKDFFEIKTGKVAEYLEVKYDSGYPKETIHTYQDIQEAKRKLTSKGFNGLGEAMTFLNSMEKRINKHGFVTLIHS